MNQGHIDSWLAGLARTLERAAGICQRGRAAFDTDPAVPLAFEALISRVGGIAKRLIAADPERFSHPSWSHVARNRGFDVHHYDRVDLELLWSTATIAFPPPPE